MTTYEILSKPEIQALHKNAVSDLNQSFDWTYSAPYENEFCRVLSMRSWWNACDQETLDFVKTVLLYSKTSTSFADVADRLRKGEALKNFF